MTVRKTGDWPGARKVTSEMKARLRQAKSTVIKREAQRFRGEVIKTFDTSGRSSGKPWEPLKPSTVANKKVGGSKPLIARGDLRNSVVVVSPPGDFSAWVGVKSTKTSSDGTRMIDIARVHEFGKIIAIRVTDKMRRFLMARAREGSLGSGGGGGGLKTGSILIIRIPQRSFLQQTADHEYGNPVATRERLLREVAQIMGPGFKVF